MKGNKNLLLLYLFLFHILAFKKNEYARMAIIRFCLSIFPLILITSMKKNRHSIGNR